jgi:NAD(P)H dehydrogenase (quinone)
MLYFTGFTVIEPFLVHAPVRISADERAAYLALYRERVFGLASAPTITYPKLADYDAHFVLKSRPRTQIDGDGIALNPPSELAVKAPPAR